MLWSVAVHSDSSPDTQPSSDSRCAAGPSTSMGPISPFVGTPCRESLTREREYTQHEHCHDNSQQETGDLNTT